MFRDTKSEEGRTIHIFDSEGLFGVFRGMHLDLRLLYTPHYTREVEWPMPIEIWLHKHTQLCIHVLGHRFEREVIHFSDSESLYAMLRSIPLTYDPVCSSLPTESIMIISAATAHISCSFQIARV